MSLPQGFDASKSAKMPVEALSKPPENKAAISIGFVSATIGYGLFAARDFRKDDFIFAEAPIMRAPFIEQDSGNRNNLRLMYEAYQKVHGVYRDALHMAFPQFAARHGVAPAPYDRVLERIDSAGTYLSHGKFAGYTVTEAEYDVLTQDLDVPATDVGPRQHREAMRDFFKDYAFRVKGGQREALVTQDACVYMLGSLVNHCCKPTTPTLLGLGTPSPRQARRLRGPNCEFRIGPQGLAKWTKEYNLAVRALRDIAAGEQLTWSYGKKQPGFECECETCVHGGSLTACRVM